MSFIDKLLEKYNLKYNDLSEEEKQTLYTWEDALNKGMLTVEKIKEYIASMRQAVENELSKHDLGDKQDMFLKARLRNYMLFESFLTSPERARQQMENMVSGIKK